MNADSIAPRLIATITYCLSDTGRGKSVTLGGSGAYHQNACGPIVPEDLPLFNVTSEGDISAVFNLIEFHSLQTFPTLLTLLRERYRRLSLIRSLIEAETIAQAAFGDIGTHPSEPTA
jgi:hypothetical protein